MWSEGTSQKAGQLPAPGTWGPPQAVCRLPTHSALEPLIMAVTKVLYTFWYFFLHVQMYMLCLNFCALNKNKTFSDNAGPPVWWTWEDGSGQQSLH